MCEFCMKHGAGKKWYLQAQNYAADRVRGSRRFRDGLRWLLEEKPDAAAVHARRMRLLDLPIVGWAAKRFITAKMKPFHVGQVLSLADVKRAFGLAAAEGPARSTTRCRCRTTASAASATTALVR